ncbi:hypothetical protein ACO0R3_004082 [Hanseniaspora guilliermondii]
MADDSIQYCDDDTLEDPIDLSSSNISNENNTNSKLVLNEGNILNPEVDRPSFIIGSGSDYNVDTIASNNNTHFSNIRKLTDALNQNTDSSNNKLKTHFKLKRTMSPELSHNQNNIKSDADTVVSRPFPIQRAASDIHHDHLRVPQAVSTSRLNTVNLQTSTPMIPNATSKEDFNSNKKSIHNLNSNNTSEDSNMDSNLNLKIKKHQTVIKLPSESQIITNNTNSVNALNNDNANNQGSTISNVNSNTNNSLQTPRIKNLSSMNKTDYFAAKLADATLEKTNRQDDQEENFVYEDLMLENDKGNNGVASQPNKTGNNDNDDNKPHDEKAAAKQSSKSVINNSQVPSGKNLTNQPSVIIDPTRLMINNQKSISSISTSINEKMGEHKMKNESTPILSGSEDANQKNSLDTNHQSFNNTNKASNLSSISNRPGNLLNNRNNIISHNGLLKNEEDNNITTTSITPDAPQQFLRPSMMNLSTASSNNNLSQYKKMMQNNARHSSVTVGVLPQNRSLLKNNSLISRGNEGISPTAPSPSLNSNDLNSGYTASTYNDILDYSSPTRNKSLNDQLVYQSPVNRKFRNKSNRNSVIQEEISDVGSYNQSNVLPDYNNGNFLTLHDMDKQKLNSDGGNLQETEISSKYSSNQLPILPFENVSMGHRAKISRTSSVVDENNDLKRQMRNDHEHNNTNNHKNGDETIFVDEEVDKSSELNDEAENNLLSSNFNNHLKKIMSGSKQSSTELKNEQISDNLVNNKSNGLSSKASNPQSDGYSTQSILTMTTTGQQKRLSNGENNFHNTTQRSKLPQASRNSQNTHKGGNEVDMDEYDNSSKKSNLVLNSPIEMISKKTSIKPGVFDGASGRHSNVVNNFSNVHHFGLDDDYDEEDFDERSSFYYRYPPRRNSTNMSKTMTFSSTSASNFGRKIRSNKGHSYDDKKIYSDQFLSPGFEDMDNEHIKDSYFGDSQKLKNKKPQPNDATLTDESNKFKDPGSQYTWGNNDMSYNDISDNQNFLGQGKHEDGSEFMSLAVNDETERLHEDGKNLFYYESIHDFYPNKNGNVDKKNPKPMDFNQYTDFYSPHDYYANNNKNMVPMYMAKYMDSSKKPKTLWERIKRFLLLVFWTVALIMIGVGLGALLVSSTELQEFSVLDMYNGIVTQDEIIFDMSCIAHNPTLFNVYVEKSNLDIFAESEYLTGGKDDTDGDDEARETILLGSVYGFETEMVFKTGIFWKHFDIARTSIKLKNPGMTDEILVADNQLLKDEGIKNSRVRTTLQPTKTSDPTETPPPRKDTKLKKWKDICKYEFTLIVKGVAYYEAPMRKGQKSLPVQYQVVVNKGKHKI